MRIVQTDFDKEVRRAAGVAAISSLRLEPNGQRIAVSATVGPPIDRTPTMAATASFPHNGCRPHGPGSHSLGRGLSKAKLGRWKGH